MAGYTNFLSLVLCGAGEYKDVWNEPVNKNFQAVDYFAAKINAEIISARFTQATLADFLAVSHEETGELKPTEEVIAARSSAIYGFNDATVETSLLKSRLDSPDWELWFAREGQSDLISASAFKTRGIKTAIISGSKNPMGRIDGAPDWLEVLEGSDVIIHATNTNLWLMINGYMARIRKNVEFDFSAYDDGSGTPSNLLETDGTYYLYAEYLEKDDSGKVIIDEDHTDEDPPAQGPGVISADSNSQYVYFSDSSKDFEVLGVKPGDILDIKDSDNIGQYVISEVGGTIKYRLKIAGIFPVSAGISGLNYTIIDPLAVKVGVDTEENLSSTSKLYIGEVTVTGGAIDGWKPRHFGDVFVSKWESFEVVTGVGITTKQFYHGLGSDNLDISVQVCQELNDDGSAAASPVEELGLTTITVDYDVELTKDLAISKTQGIVYTQPSHNSDQFLSGSFPVYDTAPTTGGTLPSYTQGNFTPGSITDPVFALTGDITAQLVGDGIYTSNSVKMKWDRTRVWVKNAVAHKFYEDFDGAAKTNGYLRVIVRRRG